MPLSIQQNYLACLRNESKSKARIWLDAEGRAQGRYFNCTLTSVFQPIRLLETGKVVGYEAFARSFAENDSGLSIWKLLESAANDDESVQLDRLCRLLHSVNFYRQSVAVRANLFLSVHERLLAAVDDNHGLVFRHALEELGLPLEKIVLQLPAVSHDRSWILAHVASNYQRNGFRIAVNTANAAEALRVLDKIQPYVIKVDAREVADETAMKKLLARCSMQGVILVFKRLETIKSFEILHKLGAATLTVLYAQGYLWDTPGGELDVFSQPPPHMTRCRPYAGSCL